MILTPNNEYCVVLDACVLAPMPLCDTLLRLADEPAFFRIAWSEHILSEVRSVLENNKFGYSKSQVDRRIDRMKSAFPDALYDAPKELVHAFQALPDPDDAHVIATAIHANANAIITDNLRHFPTKLLLKSGILVQSSDEFLVHQFHLGPEQLLEKIDAQAAAIKQPRAVVLDRLARGAPNFAKLCCDK